MALFDSKTALNQAIKYLTETAKHRAAGGWIPPKERERQQRDAMRQEQQQARQAEKQQQAQQKQFIADEKERQKNLAAFQKGNHPEVPHVVYHHGSFDETEDGIPVIGKNGMHFGTRQAAEERAYGKYKEDTVDGAEYYQDEHGKWHWYANGVESQETRPFGFNSKEIAKNHLMNELENWNEDFVPEEMGKFTQAHLSIKNPKRVSDQQNDWAEAIEKAKAEGYDGLIYRNQFEDKGKDSYVAFYPHQIKSATGNSGHFDPSNPDIRKSEGGQILSKQYPTHYMPNVGRQVMNSGGMPDDLNQVGLYSKAARVAAALPQKKAKGDQMIAALRDPKRGVKKDELINAGLMTHEGAVHPDWANRSVTTDELSQHLRDQMPQVEETQLGGETPEIKDLKNKLSQMAENDPRRFKLEQDLLFEQTNAGTKYHQYTLPGGENYREVLLKLPSKMRHVTLDEVNAQRQKISPMLPLLGQDEYDALKSSGELHKVEENPDVKFKSSHWDDPNVLAHIRMADRTGPNGEKILHVEELQSDWGQKGKKEGFDTPEMRSKLLKELPEGYVVKPSDYQRTGGVERYSVFDPNGVEIGIGNGRENAINSTLNYLNDQIRGTSASLVPAAPYVTSTEGWTDLALKRVLKEAAEGGYDKIVWTPGEEQAKRYDLSQQIDSLQYVPKTNKLYAYKNGRVVIDKAAKPEELNEIVGKDVAKNLLSSKLDDYGVGHLSHYIEGQDLAVGGEGMKGYYDKIVPSRLQALAKKHDPNARIGKSDALSRSQNNLPLIHENLPSLDVTPQMRDSILKGQEAYKRGGMVYNKPMHPAMMIAGTHIREETHGKPLFTGKRYGI